MEVQTNEKAIIITGGPGMGKTSIIGQLEQIGYSCIAESGRSIIQSELESGGNRLPWADREGFALEMFNSALADYKATLNQKRITFFDRGLPDVIGYLVVNKLPVPDFLWSAAEAYRYHSRVFITPPWKEIFINDAERKQSFEEAISTYEAMVKVYTDLNYSLMEVPKKSIQERTAFLIGKI